MCKCSKYKTRIIQLIMGCIELYSTCLVSIMYLMGYMLRYDNTVGWYNLAIYQNIAINIDKDINRMQKYCKIMRNNIIVNVIDIYYAHKKFKFLISSKTKSVVLSNCRSLLWTYSMSNCLFVAWHLMFYLGSMCPRVPT